MNSTLEHAGYIFNFTGHGAYDPNGKIQGELSQIEIDAHNGRLARAEMDHIRKTGAFDMAYKTFKRSATGWKSFGSSRKITVETGLTYSQARERCQEFNANRTPAQIRKGTMLEFTEQ